MWDRLAELEQASQHPGTVAALQSVLFHHQPRNGGCRACRRLSWCRRPYPCAVWMTTHVELLGLSSRDRPTLRTLNPDPDYVQPTDPEMGAEHPKSVEATLATTVVSRLAQILGGK